MARTRWLDPDEAAAWRGFVLMTQLVFEELDRQLRRDSDMTHADYQLLVVLSEAPARRLNVTRVASVTSWSQSRVSHAITRLERRGWVERCVDECDRRGTIAHLTDDGLAALRAAAPGHVRAVREHLVDRLDRRQLAELRAMAEAVLPSLAESPPTTARGS